MPAGNYEWPASTNTRTVSNLYTDVLGRPGDQGGLDYWTNLFGNEIDDDEYNQFKTAAQVEIDGRMYNQRHDVGKVDINGMPLMGSVEDGYGGGERYDAANSRAYMPTYGTGRYEGEIYIPGELTGYRGYGLTPGKSQGIKDLNGTLYDIYDTQGNKTGTGTWEGLGDAPTALQAALAAAAMYAGGAAMSGGIGAGGAIGTNPVLSGASMTGATQAGLGAAAGTTLSTAGGSGAFLGEGMLSGVPAWDAAALNAGVTLGAPGMALDPGSSLFPGEGMASGVPAWDAAAANAGLGLQVAPGVGLTPDMLNTIPSGSIPNNPVPGTPPPAAPPGTSGTGPSGIPPIPKGGGSGSGSLSDLMKLIPGLSDYFNQKDASSNMLAYLKERQQMNDNLYAPGSPELLAMQQQMDRKDAAAGRNSQYGTRAVDLAGQVAKIKADQNTAMTTGIAGAMWNAEKNDAAALSGLWAGLGNSGSDGITGLLEKGFDWITDLFD